MGRASCRQSRCFKWQARGSAGYRAPVSKVARACGFSRAARARWAPKAASSTAQRAHDRSKGKSIFITGRYMTVAHLTSFAGMEQGGMPEFVTAQDGAELVTMSAMGRRPGQLCWWRDGFCPRRCRNWCVRPACMARLTWRRFFDCSDGLPGQAKSGKPHDEKFWRSHRMG